MADADVYLGRLDRLARRDHAQRGNALRAQLAAEAHTRVVVGVVAEEPRLPVGGPAEMGDQVPTPDVVAGHEERVAVAAAPGARAPGELGVQRHVLPVEVALVAPVGVDEPADGERRSAAVDKVVAEVVAHVPHGGAPRGQRGETERALGRQVSQRQRAAEEAVSGGAGRDGQRDGQRRVAQLQAATGHVGALRPLLPGDEFPAERGGLPVDDQVEGGRVGVLAGRAKRNAVMDVRGGQQPAVDEPLGVDGQVGAVAPAAVGSVERRDVVGVHRPQRLPARDRGRTGGWRRGSARMTAAMASRCRSPRPPADAVTVPPRAAGRKQAGAGGRSALADVGVSN